MSQKIGFVGLGAMGLSMAKNLQAAGHDLVVHSRRRVSAEPLLEAGATWSDTPEALADEVGIVFACLPGPAEIIDVVSGPSGLRHGFSEGNVFIDFSTNSPLLARNLHAELAKEGVQMLDAPVSGGKAGAASGKLAIWASGDESCFNTHYPLLTAMGDRVRFLGGIGNASVAKLVHNCANYGIQMVLAEAFTMGVKAGVDPLTLFSAIRQGSLGRQRAVDRLADHFLPSDYDDPAFTLDLAFKDMSLASALARESSVPTKIIELTIAEMAEARNKGWGTRDSRVVMKVQADRALVEFDVDKSALRKIVESEPL